MASTKITNEDKKRLILEADWDIDDTGEDTVAAVSALDAHKKAIEAIDSIESLEKLDKTFDKFYKKIITDEDDQLFSGEVQKIELSKIASQILSDKKDSGLDEFNADEYKSIQKDLQKLFNNTDGDILKLLQNQIVHHNRKDLYEMYDEIADINFIAYRMLRVYIDNLLIKNIQTKSFLNVIENYDNKKLTEINETKLNLLKKFVEMLIVYFDIQNRLKNEILPKELKYGDFYIEVVNLGYVDEIVKKNPGYLLTETEILEGTFELNNKKYRKVKFAKIELPIRRERSNEIFEFENPDLSPEAKFELKLKKLKKKITRKGQYNLEENVTFLNNLETEKTLEEKIDRILNIDLDNLDKIFLRAHDPAHVIKIEKDGIFYGYIIIEEDNEDKDTEDEINLYKRFLSDNEYENQEKEKNKDIADQIADKISERIAEYLRTEEQSFDDLPEEVKLSLRVIIYHKLTRKSKIKFRFINTDKLVNFHTFIDKYAPYATSIFDPIVQPVKMYTIGLMTSLVSRLSRASVIRKWNIEVGNKRDYQKIVETVKKDLRNKSVTYDSLTSIKNISKIITDFKDIATITKDGQRYIDLEILPLHDRSLPIQELQDLRNELLMATGIPSVYLNSAEAIDLRETLVNLNINFANNIMTLQSFIEDALNQLMNIIVKELLILEGEEDVDFNISSVIKVTMNAPLVLQLQQSEALVGSIINIVSALAQARFEINPEELLKMYIPQINWDKLKKSGEKVVTDEIKKQIMQQTAGENHSGGF